jgi:hypothetical protein
VYRPDTGHNVDAHTSDVSLTLCSDGSYCCGALNNDCCLSKQGFWVDNFQVYPYVKSPFTTSTSNQPMVSQSTALQSSAALIISSNSMATAVQTSTLGGSLITIFAMTAASSSAPTSANVPHKSNDLAIGLGAGLGAALLILVGITCFAIIKRRQRRHRNQLALPVSGYQSQDALSADNNATKSRDIIAPHYELPNTHQCASPKELHAPDLSYSQDTKERLNLQFQEMPT